MRPLPTVHPIPRPSSRTSRWPRTRPTTTRVRPLPSEGYGWTGDDTVTIVVKDDDTGDVIFEGSDKVGTKGGISATFDLPKTFIANLKVKVTGDDTDRVGTATFSEKVLEKVTIESDKGDYAPGSTVILSGTGWTPDQEVRLIVNDTIGQTWQHDMVVKVSEDGTITEEFTLPDYFVATYDVTAIGRDTLRMASTTFSDSPYTAKVTVRKAGARTGSNPTPLDGAEFYFYKMGTDTSTVIPNRDPDYKCTTGTANSDGSTPANPGECFAAVQHGNSPNSHTERVLVFENSAPPGFNKLEKIATGTYTSTAPIAYQPVMPTNVSVTNNTGVTLPSSGYTANRADNPNWPGFCGMNVALLFDESDSINADNWKTMTDAAAGFVELLIGTPSKVATFSFGTDKIEEHDVQLADATQSLADGIRARGTPGNPLYKKTNPLQYTNWDAGLMQIVNKSALTGHHYDAVIVLTDGDPTTYVGGSTGTSVSVANVIQGVYSANAVKAMTGTKDNNTRVVSVGISMQDNSVWNLQAISGPNAGSDYFATSWDALDSALAEISKQQCGGTVFVEKQIGSSVVSTPTLTDASDNWPFSIEIRSGGGSVGAPVPPNAPGVPNTQGKTCTDNNGKHGQLQWKLSGGTSWPKTVRITETASTNGSGSFTLSDMKCTGGTTTGSGSNYIDVQVPQSGSVKRAFANSRNTGTLVLAKAALTTGPADYTGPFSIGYSCTLAGSPLISGSRSVAAGAQSAAIPVPSGYSCTVTETLPVNPPAGWRFADPTYAPAQTVPIPDTDGASVKVTTTNTLLRNSGSLVLAKAALTTGPADYTGPFSIGYSCTLAGSPLISGSRSVAAGAQSAAIPVPSGYSCTVTETLPVNPPAGWRFADPTYAPAQTVPIPDTDGASVKVTTTNTLLRNSGSLVLSKAALTTGPADYTGPFSIGYSCTLAGSPLISGSRSVAAGAQSAAIPVPSGYSCTVTETLPVNPPAGWRFADPTYAPAQTVPIPDTDGASVKVTTTNTLLRNSGSLVLAKAALTTGPADYTGPFSIGYSCTLAGSPLISGSRSVAAGAQSAAIPVPSGYSCTVTETLPVNPPAGWRFADPTYAPAQTVPIPDTDGASVKVTTTNTLLRNSGSLVLSKAALTTGPADYTGPFSIGYSCTLAGSPLISGSRSVAAGAQSAAIPVPSGYSCTVTETLPVNPPAGWRFADPTYAPAQTVPIPDTDGASVKVTTTNTLLRNSGSLVLAKAALTTGPADYTGPFSIGYSCTLAGSPLISGSRSVAAGAQSAAIPVPSGYSCTVTETLPVNPPAGWRFADPTYAPAQTVPIPDTDGASVKVTTTNTLLRNSGSLVLSKAALTTGPADYTGPFSIGYSCTLAGSPLISGSRSVAAGAQSAAIPVPSGYSCTVTETLPVNPPAGWRFADPTYAPAQTVPIPDTDGASVKVTTTNTLLRNSGSLVLAKAALTTGPADYTGPFSIGYSCTLAGSPLISGSRSVAAGAQSAAIPVPSGYRAR